MISILHRSLRHKHLWSRFLASGVLFGFYFSQKDDKEAHEWRTKCDEEGYEEPPNYSYTADNEILQIGSQQQNENLGVNNSFGED